MIIVSVCLSWFLYFVLRKLSWCQTIWVRHIVNGWILLDTLVFQGLLDCLFTLILCVSLTLAKFKGCSSDIEG